MLSIKLKFNHWLPKALGAEAITLYPYIFFACDKATAVADHTINHEWIHVEQVRNIGWLKFYASYLFNYLKLYLKLRDQQKAYEAIPYEAEAFAGQAIFVLPQEALDTLSRS
jgi:hypothetical protein